MSAITEKIKSIDSPVAVAAISAKQGYGVKFGASAHSIDVAGSGDNVQGVIYDNGDFAIGDPVPVVNQPGDLVMAIAGGSIAIGAKVNTDSAGKFVTVSAAGAAFYGYAETTGVTGKAFALRIMPGVINVTGFAQAATSSGGEISIASLTSSAVVIVTLAEDPGSNLVLSHIVAATGKITVYTGNTNTDAKAVLNAKLVNYLVLSL
jgi:hypothetical protein